MGGASTANLASELIATLDGLGAVRDGRKVQRIRSFPSADLRLLADGESTVALEALRQKEAFL